MQLSDDKLAGKLTKLLKSYEKNFKVEKIFDELWDKLYKINKRELSNEIEDALGSACFDMRKNEINHTIRRDNVLKHIEEYV